MDYKGKIEAMKANLDLATAKATCAYELAKKTLDEEYLGSKTNWKVGDTAIMAGLECWLLLRIDKMQVSVHWEPDNSGPQIYYETTILSVACEKEAWKKNKEFIRLYYSGFWSPQFVHAKHGESLDIFAEWPKHKP